MDYNNDNKKKNKRRGKGEGSIIKLPKDTKRELLEAIDKIKAKLLSPSGKTNKPKVTFSNFATCFEETKRKDK